MKFDGNPTENSEEVWIAKYRAALAEKPVPPAKYSIVRNYIADVFQKLAAGFRKTQIPAAEKPARVAPGTRVPEIAPRNAECVSLGAKGRPLSKKGSARANRTRVALRPPRSSRKLG
jgi:hypothetical protein